MQEIPFQRPKFQKISRGDIPPAPLELCRNNGLPLTKIVATPLSAFIHSLNWWRNTELYFIGGLTINVKSIRIQVRY